MKKETESVREKEKWNLYSQFSDVNFTSQPYHVIFTSQLPNDHMNVSVKRPPSSQRLFLVFEFQVAT